MKGCEFHSHGQAEHPQKSSETMLVCCNAGTLTALIITPTQSYAKMFWSAY